MRMLDSVTVGNLPHGAGAYLGYNDGHFNTWHDLVARFAGDTPRPHLLDMSVFASDNATGLDIETLDATPEQAPGWTARQLARGVDRPVLYSSVSRMEEVIGDLRRQQGIARSQVRLLSAHYGIGKHICGPSTCRFPGLTHAMDGTQWTDQAPGLNGSKIDESLLLPTFFGGTVSATGPEKWDKADWAAVDAHADTLPYKDIAPRVNLWWLARALNGDTSDDPVRGKMSDIEKAHVVAVHRAFTGQLTTTIGAMLPPDAVTQEELQAIVEAGVSASFSAAFPPPKP